MTVNGRYAYGDVPQVTIFLFSIHLMRNRCRCTPPSRRAHGPGCWIPLQQRDRTRATGFRVVGMRLDDHYGLARDRVETLRDGTGNPQKTGKCKTDCAKHESLLPQRCHSSLRKGLHFRQAVADSEADINFTACCLSTDSMRNRFYLLWRKN